MFDFSSLSGGALAVLVRRACGRYVQEQPAGGCG